MKKITKEWVRENVPKRRRNSHKGDYGKAAIVAGSAAYTGAAYLATAACLRSGAGYTALYVPKDLFFAYVLKAPEALLRTMGDGERFTFCEEEMKSLLDYDCVAYGMGMGQSEEVFQGARWLLQHYSGKLLIDADGLNALAKYGNLREAFAGKACEVVLTPHVKEFSRLSGCSVEEILENGREIAEKFSRTYGVVTLLKNARSLVSDGVTTAYNDTGNSGQAKGGSGDVLSGVIAGLMAQGADGFTAAACGAYLVGKAAELGAKTVGEYSLTASNLIETLGGAFLFVTEYSHEDGSQQQENAD